MLKIGDVSRVLGISSQSVRKYEELGIAQISKSEHSGYRQFNLRSLNQLLRVRFYRKAEFDLVTATKLINTIDLDFVADTLKHQQRVLAESIRILKYKQAKLAELELQLRDIPKLLNHTMLWNSPDCRYLPYYDDGKITITNKSAPLLSKMVELMPLATTSPMLRRKAGRLDIATLEYGMICETRYIKDTELLEKALHIPAQSCVYTVIRKDTITGHVGIDDLSELLALAKENGIAVKYIVGRTIISMRDKDRSVRYHEFWTIS